MTTELKCYTLPQVLALLQISRRQFFRLKKLGRTPPMLEELLPRVGQRRRYRADLIDRWLSGSFTAPRSFSLHKRRA